ITARTAAEPAASTLRILTCRMRLPVPSIRPSGFGRSAPAASWRFTWDVCGMIANNMSRVVGPVPKASSRSGRSTIWMAAGIASSMVARRARAVAETAWLLGARSVSNSASTEPGCGAPRRSTCGTARSFLARDLAGDLAVALADDDVDQPTAAGLDHLERLAAVERGPNFVAGEDNLLEL